MSYIKIIFTDSGSDDVAGVYCAERNGIVGFGGSEYAAIESLLWEEKYAAIESLLWEEKIEDSIPDDNE